jgi:GT2 family glycosyltransferase/glycosyltransferase involved in cell wall biosynthesis
VVSPSDPRGDPAWWPLRLGLRLLRTLGDAAPRSPRPDRGWRPGLSVVLPDRDRPDLLDSTLPALQAALARIDEPSEVWISTSAAATTRYAALRQRYPAFHWLHAAEPLGFSAAIARALPRLRHDHAYLLNSDMRLHPHALREVLAQRGARVFAVASQIHHEQASARREETGLTALTRFAGPSQLYDAWPGEDPTPREHLYAGGGASLFRTAALRRFAAASAVYEPVYWEDVEWGLRAWREGWRVLFCPTSLAWHGHRSTVRKVFDAAEIDRLFARNGRWFDLRHADGEALGSALDRVVCADPRSRAEARGLRFAAGTLAMRWRRRHAPAPEAWFLRRDSLQLGYGRRRGGKPRLLLISPFALLPTSHGSARRSIELLRGLAARFDLALLSDEATLYPPGHEPALAELCVLWLRVQGRDTEVDGETWPQRAARHAWTGLRSGLAEARRQFAPETVLVAHAELLDLGSERQPGERWLIDLHDVPALADDEDNWFRRGLAAFDAAIATSADDHAALRELVADPRRAWRIDNGATLRPQLPPSPSSPPGLLFVGGLRYPPNRDGLLAFLERVWPRLRGQIPDLRLCLAGVAPDELETLGITDGAGIDALGNIDDLGPQYAAASLCLNPLRGIRGSALKAIEALAAGRVCVSTRDGARGLLDGGFAGLRVVEQVADMTDAILDLLADPGRRHALERFDAARLDAWSWPARAAALADHLDASAA